MTKTNLRDLAAHCTRALPNIRSLQKKPRAQGRPGGRMHPGPRARMSCARRVDHRYRRRHSDLPRTMVYGLYGALLGEPAFATVARAMR